MKLYKLTDAEGQTHNGFAWEIGEKQTLPVVSNPRLCTGDVLHAYKSPALGLLLNPIHADIEQPRLFEAEGIVAISDWDKVGCSELTLLRELPLPDWYTDAGRRKKVCVTFSVLCAEAVLPNFEAVFPGDDRPRNAIAAAREWLLQPSDSAASAARAARAAYRAASAANAAADSAASADNAADDSVANAASAAAAADDSAASAASAAYRAANSVANAAADSVANAARAAAAARAAYRAASAAAAAADSVANAARAARAASTASVDFAALADMAVAVC